MKDLQVFTDTVLDKARLSIRCLCIVMAESLATEAKNMHYVFPLILKCCGWTFQRKRRSLVNVITYTGNSSMCFALKHTLF